MTKSLAKGDRVTWKSHGGKAHGKVIRKQTLPTKIKGHTVRASEDDPQFIVETEEGKRAAHKPAALKKDYSSYEATFPSGERGSLQNARRADVHE